MLVLKMRCRQIDCWCIAILRRFFTAADNSNLICSQQYSFPACYVISTNCNSISKRLGTASIFTLIAP